MPNHLQYTCLHTHTIFCDGKADVETFCRQAFDKGLHSLGFSAHAPIEKKTGFPRTNWTMKEELMGEYIDTVNAAKSRWEGRLRVFLGLEVDYIPGLMGPADSEYRELGLDYIIGSVHYIIPSRGAPFTVDSNARELQQRIQESYNGDPSAVTEAYFNSLETMISTGGLDIIGHPDLIRKSNSKIHFFDEDSEFYRKRCASAAALAGKGGIITEVNTGGMNRGYIETPYPSRVLLELFCKNKVPAVINADAHRPEDLNGYYEEARQALLDAGYKKMVLLEGRKNNRPVWIEKEL